MNNNAYTVKTMENNCVIEYGEINDGGIYLEKFQYDVSDEINVIIVLELIDSIENYNYIELGFNIVSGLTITNNKVSFVVEYDGLDKNPTLQFTIYLDNWDLSKFLNTFLYNYTTYGKCIQN